jgi:hypothetical protein
LSLRNSISKSESGAGGLGPDLGRWLQGYPLNLPPLATVMSEAGSETLEDEWQSISEIASTCNTILESLSREGEATRALGGEAGMGLFLPFRPANMVPLSHRTAHPRERRAQGNSKV